MRHFNLGRVLVLNICVNPLQLWQATRYGHTH